MLAGIGVLVGTGWAPTVAIGAAGLSLASTLLTFHPWLSLNVVINALIIVLAMRAG